MDSTGTSALPRVYSTVTAPRSLPRQDGEPRGGSWDIAMSPNYELRAASSSTGLRALSRAIAVSSVLPCLGTECTIVDFIMLTKCGLSWDLCPCSAILSFELGGPTT